MKHSKRYAVIFNKWSVYKNIESVTEFDTLKEVNEEVELLEMMYKDTPRPEHKYASWNKYAKFSKSTIVTDYHWLSADAGEAFWGYLVVDFEDERILKWGHEDLRAYKRDTDSRKLKDWLFRKPNEIPKDYKWDIGEYDGWLQYRWGNGRNALKYGENAVIEGIKDSKTCIRRCKFRKKKNYTTKPYNEVEEAELDKLSSEILEEVESKTV